MHDIVALTLTNDIGIGTNLVLVVETMSSYRQGPKYPAASIGGAFPLPAKNFNGKRECFTRLD